MYCVLFSLRRLITLERFLYYGRRISDTATSCETAASGLHNGHSLDKNRSTGSWDDTARQTQPPPHQKSHHWDAWNPIPAFALVYSVHCPLPRRSTIYYTEHLFQYPCSVLQFDLSHVWWWSHIQSSPLPNLLLNTVAQKGRVTESTTCYCSSCPKYSILLDNFCKVCQYL